jgi:hypothetical protein
MGLDKLAVTHFCLIQWQVQHFGIIGLDRLLDSSSLESMNEEHTIGDSLDEAEQEEMHHEVCLSVSLSLSLALSLSQPFKLY